MVNLDVSIRRVLSKVHPSKDPGTDVLYGVNPTLPAGKPIQVDSRSGYCVYIVTFDEAEIRIVLLELWKRYGEHL